VPKKGCSHVQATTVDPDGDGKLCRLIDARWPDDIEEQAILGQGVADVVATVSHTGRRVGRCGCGPIPRRVQGFCEREALCWLRTLDQRRLVSLKAITDKNSVCVCVPYLRITHAQEEVLVVFGAVEALVRSIPDRDDGSRPGAQRRVHRAAPFPLRGHASIDGGDEQRASHEGFQKRSHLWRRLRKRPSSCCFRERRSEAGRESERDTERARVWCRCHCNCQCQCQRPGSGSGSSFIISQRHDRWRQPPPAPRGNMSMSRGSIPADRSWASMPWLPTSSPKSTPRTTTSAGVLPLWGQVRSAGR
jgi:hypothetical protein